jgi:hypothetical protein
MSPLLRFCGHVAADFFNRRGSQWTEVVWILVAMKVAHASRFGTPPTDCRQPLMTEEPLTSAAIESLLDRATRARRLAIWIRGDPAADRLDHIADELEEGSVNAR